MNCPFCNSECHYSLSSSKETFNEFWVCDNHINKVYVVVTYYFHKPVNLALGETTPECCPHKKYNGYYILVFKDDKPYHLYVHEQKLNIIISTLVENNLPDSDFKIIMTLPYTSSLTPENARDKLDTYLLYS